MDLIINNTESIKSHVKQYYDNVLDEKEAAVVDKLDKEKKQRLTKAHQHGKNKLEHQKRIITKRKDQAYQEEQSQKVTALRERKSTLLKKLRRQTINNIEKDEKAIKKLKTHIKNVVRKSTSKETEITIEGDTIQTLRAEAKEGNKRYVYTAQKVVEDALKKYWADIAPDIRL